MPSPPSRQLVATVKSLADPVRWQIVERLVEGPCSATDLGKGFDISAPAVSRHLKVLLEGGVVEVEAQGRQRMYSLRPRALRELSTSLLEMAGEEQVDVPKPSISRRPEPVAGWQVW